jgi:aryl-alcohol dehydrogenase-like predicted oxidoreductase
VSEQQVKASAALGASIAGVALAYVMCKALHVILICGGRKTDHVKGNIDAASA